MPHNRTLSLPPDEAIDLTVQVGRASIRRASMLMAYGINTAREAPGASYHLPGFIQLVNAPEEIPAKAFGRFRSDYEAWVVANGLRELHEGLEAFLNSFHQIALRTENHLNRTNDSKARKRNRDFERKGVNEKLLELSKRYSFDTGFADHYRSLNQVRNCLTHRRGVVGDQDLNEANLLQLTWLGVEAKIIESDGKEHPISLETQGPFDGSSFCQDGDAQLEVRLVDRAASFEKGDRIHIKARSLQEICAMTDFVCMKLRQLMMNWLLDQGVRVNGGERVPEPKLSISLEAEEIVSA